MDKALSAAHLLIIPNIQTCWLFPKLQALRFKIQVSLPCLAPSTMLSRVPPWAHLETLTSSLDNTEESRYLGPTSGVSAESCSILAL